MIKKSRLIASIFFVYHIARNAKVTTNKWQGYRLIVKIYDIKQIESNKGLNFKAFNTIIDQVKSGIRTTYSWVSDANLNRYFNEFCYRIYRSQNKNTIFDNLINKMGDNQKNQLN